jgi:hypothetical protein
LRDCGFAQQQDKIACTAGKPVHITCRVGDDKPTQVLRVCDNSAKLGGIACMYGAALANATVAGRETRVSFPCPTARDSDEPGGSYALYVAPVLPTEATAHVTCAPSH